MTDPEVDALRQQLRERGYLSHGIERWFALDPWSSRAFWLELATVALKAGLLVALFGVLPLVAIMLFRNHPLAPLETLALTVVYGAAWLVLAAVLIVTIALILKLRPELALDTPRALLGISFAASAVLTSLIAIWWWRFATASSIPELLVGLGLTVLFFLMSTVIVSAALLSFSIYELRRLPAIHQKPRGKAMAIAAVVLLALLFLPAYASQEKRVDIAPLQVVTTPTTRHVALIAVDGLTEEIARSRPDLTAGFAVVQPLAPLAGQSTAERWASLGTGVPTRIHGVRAIEGVRIATGRHVLQSLSSADFVLLDLMPRLGLARRQPLPPTVRRRDYVWELFARRGMPVAAANWWTSESVRAGALDSIGQETIFAAANGDALRVDAEAMRRLDGEIDRTHPQFATLYLPALDVILNRLTLDQSKQLTMSVHALDGIATAIHDLHGRGYGVIVIGLPGDRQAGNALFASTMAMTNAATPFDIAPTLCTLLGFPASDEMPGHVLVPVSSARIATFGPRASTAAVTKLNDEYYENLRSLGYIR